MMEKRRKGLLGFVRILRQKRIITEGSYCDYLCLILAAETPDQLDEIALDFVEICCSMRDHQNKIGQGKEKRRATPQVA
jgi:hypothetical protein